MVQFKFMRNFVCVEAVKVGCYVNSTDRPAIMVRFPGFLARLRGITLQSKVHRAAAKVQVWCAMQNEKERPLIQPVSSGIIRP